MGRSYSNPWFKNLSLPSTITVEFDGHQAYDGGLIQLDLWSV